MEYPNKTYILDKIVEMPLGNEVIKRKHIVLVAAKNEKIAAQYLRDKLGFEGHENELVWLMNTNHLTMYDQTGNKELNVQAKILYNTVTIMK